MGTGITLWGKKKKKKKQDLAYLTFFFSRYALYSSHSPVMAVATAIINTACLTSATVAQGMQILILGTEEVTADLTWQGGDAILPN